MECQQRLLRDRCGQNRHARVDEVAEKGRVGEQAWRLLPARVKSLAVGESVDDSANHHPETLAPEHFGQVRRKQADITVNAPQKAGFLAFHDPEIAPPPVREEVSQEADKIAAFRAFGHLRRKRDDDRADQSAQVRRLPSLFHLGEQSRTVRVDLRNPPTLKGADDVVLAPEVIMDCRLIPLSGGKCDLPTRHRLDAKLGKQPRGGDQQNVFGVCHDHPPFNDDN
jgi:hypothetical protein